MKSRLLLIALGFLALTGCAVPVEVISLDEPSGFWMGLLHGFIILFSFIGSLFSDQIAIYDANNTGGWYDFGFLLGVSVFFGGSGSSASRKG